MATGKTNSRWMRTVCDEVDISGDLRELGEFGIEFPEDDVTGKSNGVINVLLGQPRLFLESLNAVFNNTANTGSYTELSAREEYLVTIAIGIRAAPTAGDPCFSAPLEQGSFLVSDGGGAVVISANFPGPGQNHTLPSKVFGEVLAYNQQFTVPASSNASGTAVDNGASSANGAYAYLHITTASAGALTIKVQDSPDDTTYADHITFTADGTSVTAEQGSSTGTVDRYTRIRFENAIATQRTITVSASIVRQ